MIETKTTPAPALTPTARNYFRNRRFWLIAGVLVVLFAIATVFFRAGGDARGIELGAQDATPVGSRAIVRVLEKHGVSVHVAKSYDEAIRLSTEYPATLLYSDPQDFVDTDRVQTLFDTAENTVVLRPGLPLLAAVLPTVRLGGVIPDDAAEGCTGTALTKAKRISSGTAYRIDGGDGCFGSAETGFVVVRPEGSTVTVMGTIAPLQNQSVLEEDNAAVAFALLGQTEHVVWYLPSSVDLEATQITSLQDATPKWLTPVLGLLMITAITAMLWRARRFGALVAEDLPVIVPAAETMHGRARLYATIGARNHALNALRIGTADRLARDLGLGRGSDIREIAMATADRSGMSRAHIMELLLTREIGSERELIDAAQELRRVEAAVARTTPGSTQEHTP